MGILINSLGNLGNNSIRNSAAVAGLTQIQDLSVFARSLQPSTTFEGYAAFPTLRTRRIIISGAELSQSATQRVHTHANIKIEAVISTSLEDNTLQPSWFKVKEFAQFVKFYFVLADGTASVTFPQSGGVLRFQSPSPDTFGAGMLDPARRVDFVMAQGTQSPSSRDIWDTFLENLPMAQISLSDILLQENSNVSQVDLGTGDILFEVEISGFNLNKYAIGESGAENIRLRQTINTNSGQRIFDIPQKLSLISFSHLDIEKMVSEFNLSALRSGAIDGLSRVGGNMTYDTLMAFDQDTGRHLVPSIRRVFSIPPEHSPSGRLTAYNGPAKYYGTTEASPRPNGISNDYVGWVSTTNPATPLVASEGRNNKVHAPILIEDQDFVSGYFGSNAIYDIEDGDNGTILSAGLDDPQRKLRISTDYFLESQIQLYHEKLKNHVLDSYNKNSAEIIVDQEEWIELAENPPRQRMGGYEFSLSVPKTSLGGAERTIRNGQKSGYHNVYFGIDYYKIIRTNSKYGHFLNSLRNSGHWGAQLDILAKSDIASMTILRRRITNEPYGNGVFGADAYKYHDLSEYDEIMITTADRPSGRFSMKLEEARNDKAHIKEMNVSYEPGVGTLIRSFWIKDYDLFENINFGKYTYILELEIKDGIKEFLYEAVYGPRGLSNLINRYEAFLREAATPAIPAGKDRYYGAPEWHASIYGTPAISQDDSPPQGNYDYNLGKYAPSFSDPLVGYRVRHGSVVEDLASKYIELVRLLDHEGQDLSSWMETITNSILPEEGGTIEMAEVFYEQCVRLKGTYEKILESDKYNYQPGSTGDETDTSMPVRDFSSGENMLSGGTGTMNHKIKKDTISLRVDMKFVIDSVKDGTIFRDYGLGSLIPGWAQFATIANMPTFVAAPNVSIPPIPPVTQIPNRDILNPGAIQGMNSAGGQNGYVTKLGPVWTPIRAANMGSSNSRYSIQPVAYSRFFGGQSLNIINYNEINSRNPSEQNKIKSCMNQCLRSSSPNTAANFGPASDWDTVYNNAFSSYSSAMQGLSFGIIGLGAGLAEVIRDLNTEPEDPEYTTVAKEIEGVLCEAAVRRTPNAAWVGYENLKWIEDTFARDIANVYDLVLDAVDITADIPGSVVETDIDVTNIGIDPFPEIGVELGNLGAGTLQETFFDNMSANLEIKIGPSRVGADMLAGAGGLMTGTGPGGIRIAPQAALGAGGGGLLPASGFGSNLPGGYGSSPALGRAAPNNMLENQQTGFAGNPGGGVTMVRVAAGAAPRMGGAQTNNAMLARATNNVAFVGADESPIAGDPAARARGGFTGGSF